MIMFLPTCGSLLRAIVECWCHDHSRGNSNIVHEGEIVVVLEVSRNREDKERGYLKLFTANNGVVIWYLGIESAHDELLISNYFDHV